MEVKLWNDPREREMHDNFADLYAIINATEKLEKAFIRDLIPSSHYESECFELIAHFKTLASAINHTVPTIHEFAQTYKIDSPAAINRLLISGVPATVEHRAAAAAASSAAAVAECVQNFITAMDSLKLNMVAVDQGHPLLSDLSGSLSKLSILGADFEGNTKVREWLGRLSRMGAADELTESESESRQLHFDLESSYNSFMAALPSAGA